jgi:hypothetical protein
LLMSRDSLGPVLWISVSRTCWVTKSSRYFPIKTPTSILKKCLSMHTWEHYLTSVVYATVVNDVADMQQWVADGCQVL